MPSSTDSANKAKPAAILPASQASDLGLPLKEPETVWNIQLKAEEAVMLNTLRNLFALKATAAVPSWATPGATEPGAAQDGNLLTSWKCRPDDSKAPDPKSGPCAVTLVFPGAATVCKVRLFASSADTEALHKQEGKIARIRLISDKGKTEVSLIKRWNYQHIDIPGCVETKTLTVEPLSDAPLKSGEQFHIAEMEALGTAGEAREPISISGRFFYVRAEGPMWGQTPSADGNYAGNETAPAWVEMSDGSGVEHAERLLRGHRWSLFGDNRFLIVENVQGASCPGAEYHEGGRYSVFDLNTRVLYAVGGGPDLEGRILLNEKKPRLVYMGVDIASGEGGASVFDLSKGDSKVEKHKFDGFDAYSAFVDGREKEGFVGFPTSRVPSAVSFAPAFKPLSKTKLQALKRSLLVSDPDNPTGREVPLIDDSFESSYGFIEVSFSRGSILEGGQTCGGEALVISWSKAGEVLDVLTEGESRPRVEHGIAHMPAPIGDYSTSDAEVMFFDDKTPLIEMEQSGGDGGDIYRLDENGKFILILQNALFQLGAPSDCQCQA
jgi:hypothetical protein